MRIDLDESDWRLLDRLNFRKSPVPLAQSARIEKLETLGLVERDPSGGHHITVQGQLALYRRRFRKIPRARYAFSGQRPRIGFWSRLRNR